MITEQELEKKQFIPHTRAQHNLWEWLATDYANFNLGQGAGSEAGKYQVAYARKALKDVYMENTEYKLDNKPVETFLKAIDGLLELTEEERIDLKLAYVKSIQDMFRKKDKTFSTAIYLMSKNEMTDFISFIIGHMRDMNIPFRKEIADLMKENEYESFVWVSLRDKTCEVCGRYGDLHHVDHVGSYGRKNDDGRGKRVTCLCREHHSEIHADYKAYDKHGIKGIYLNDKQIKILRKKYPAQFKAFKE